MSVLRIEDVNRTGSYLNNMINKIHSANKKHLKPISDKESEKFIPRPYKNIAEGMEKQFVQFMIEQMNKSVGTGDESSSADYYKDLLTDERAEALTKVNGGVGIQNLILNQIYPKKFRNELAYNQFLEHTKSKIRSRDNIEMAGPKPDSQKIEKTKANAIDKYHQAQQGGRRE